jgi:hypothetical protein
MSWLSLLLVFKIVMTGLLVSVPFLLLPQPKLQEATRVMAPSPLFFRLYAIAITALLVGYGSGIPMAESGHFPWGIVFMGIVSNAGAAILLLSYSRENLKNRLLGSFFGVIAFALIASALFAEGSLQKAW